MLWPFVVNRTYSRQKDLHGVFGGQPQGGISTPINYPGIFAFTKEGGKNPLYRDRFLPDGSLLYTGEGQSGDMVMRVGNKAIRDHVQNGEDVLVFSQRASGGPVTFKGLFVSAGWHLEDQPGADKELRKAIVFTLNPLLEVDWESVELASDSSPSVGIQEMRVRAYASATSEPAATTSTKRTTYQRAKDVRDYVLARAAGRCEACENPAPFVTASRQPYLEAHHLRRLSDGGPDHPAHVAGVCPTCHRRAHFAADGQTFNATLAGKIAIKEAASIS